MKFATLEAVFRALNQANVRYIVAGGVAVNAHGYQRVTQELDLVVSLEPTNVLAGMDALEGLGFRPILPVSGRDFADPDTRDRWMRERNLEVFSLTSDRHPETTVDPFAREPFDFDVEYHAAMVAEVAEGVDVRFVRLETLLEMKESTGRPRDMDDAQHLRTIQEMNGP